MKHLLITIVAVGLMGCGPNIYDAAGSGNIGAVKKHLDAGVDVNTRKHDINGKAPLHTASRWGHTEIANLLITAGADVNAESNSGSVPLGIAAYAGYKQIVALLISNGANVNIKDKSGSTPLHYALRMYEPSMQHKQIIELLIANGANVNAKENAKIIQGTTGGMSALHYSAKAGSKETTELLISKGANINPMNTKEETPLHIAAYKGNKDTVRILIAANANINETDKKGSTPLDHALHEENSDPLNPFFKIRMKSFESRKEVADLLRKHGGKTGEELKSEGK